MKKTSLKKRILKIILPALILSVFIAQNTVFAGTFEGWLGQEVGSWFQTGDKGLSFVQYEGALAELSTEGYDSALVQSTDFREYILTIVNFALGFLGLIAVIIVIYGGVLYVTAGGEEENTQKGKKAIQYAVIGLLIVLGSFAFVNTVIRGAMGQEESGAGLSQTSGTVSGGFNAAAEQVRALALEIYGGYIYVAEVSEELKGIENDAGKDSMLPASNPPKTDVIAFLQSVKSKVSAIKSKAKPFSKTGAVAGDIVRKLEKDIDKVKAIKSPGKSECKQDQTADSWGEGIDNGMSSGDTIYQDCLAKEEADYYVAFNEKWTPLQEEYVGTKSGCPTTPTATLECLLKSVTTDYSVEFSRILVSLDQIYNTYANIDAVKTGGAGAYINLSGASGYGYEVGSVVLGSDGTSKTPVNSLTAGALGQIKNWVWGTKVEEVGALIAYGLENQSKLYETLKNLQFVQARLSADTVSGAAPLVVIFDTLGSIDPAGGTIDTTKIMWDLEGSYTLMELLNAEVENPEETGDVVCTTALVNANGDELIGKFSRRCIFNKPGNYQSAIKIKSNDELSFAPGVSVLSIKVTPPSTQIELTATPGTSTTEMKQVMHYDPDTGVLLTDKNRINFTSGDAKQGINLSAAGTGAESYRWTFDNGTMTDWSPGGETVEFPSQEPGEYQVILEVQNKLGVIDKKIFTIEISSIAASLNSDHPDGAKVNREVVFDASGSKSDKGKITNYSWSISTIKPDSITDQAIIDEIDSVYPGTIPFEEGADLSKFKHTFKFPIDYKVSVTVSDGASNVDTAYIEKFKVTSDPPVASFDFNIPSERQPGTVHLNGAKSYDPDGTDWLSYQWSITPDTYELVDSVEHGLDSITPQIKFLEKGDYEVTLKVVDQINQLEFDELKQTVPITNVLDVAWATDIETIFRLDDDGKAEASFEVLSEKAIAYEADFGDGSDEVQGDIQDGIEHVYTKAGKYKLTVTVYDEDDNDNVISINVFVASGDKPVAKVKILLNGNEIQDLSAPVKVTKADELQFDASDSINTDGTGRKLKYSWSFGDTKNSTKETAVHKYKELSPNDPGYYEIKLTVTDEEDAAKTASDEISIDVVNISPKFSNVIGIPHSRVKPFTTPVPVTLKVFGAEDEDGEIVKYRWWYFDVETPDEPIDMAITQSPTAQLTVGTNGKEGDVKVYGFGLEITDNDNIKYSNADDIEAGNISTVEVINGKNELPTADFTISSTTIFAGEEITFTSASKDLDGNIAKYYWDVEGDGFFNNEPSEEATLKYTYTEKNLEGFDVKLKVIDDKGGEAVSSAKKVYVDSKADAPKAAFKYEVIDGSNGMKVQFQNNSNADEDAGAEILSYSWDFDTASTLPSADSDGDGVKDNDKDANIKDPKRLFGEAGIYLVKLTIVDNQGNSDDVINEVKVPLANAPTAAFTYEIVAGKVKFTNKSLPDPNSSATIVKYQWDFDTASMLPTADGNGDSIKDNDNDSSTANPEHEYTATGKYTVKLTVFDDQSNEASVSKDVEFSIIDNVIANPPTGNGGLTGTGGLGGTPTGGNTGGGTVNPLPTGPFQAVLTTNPLPEADGIIYLKGEKGVVSFNFAQSIGAISNYSIDKNIYFDTDGNNVKTDDKDFNSPLPGTWTTNFEKVWGKIVVKLTITDINGNKSDTTIEIKFRD